MLKFKDYIYDLYQLILYRKGRLISDSEDLLIFEFKYPFEDNKGNIKIFRLRLPFGRARVADLKERNLLIYFFDGRIKDFTNYKTDTTLKKLEEAQVRILNTIKQEKNKNYLPLLSYLLYDWLFLYFCKELFKNTGDLKYGKRDLNKYRKDRVLLFIDALKWIFPYDLVEFFQNTIFMLLKWYIEIPLIKNTISRTHKIKYLNNMKICAFYKKYQFAFPLYTNRFPGREIIFSKIVNKNDIEILKNHIERPKPNISISLNIIKKEETKLEWLEILKKELSNWRYEISFWNNELSEKKGYPIIFFISLKNRGFF